ncbi:16S rRNA (adenine(1518)-N(6)/adenine(1519)-N(6))-dimethyltransferase RsmA [Spiroplasma endosymbiont of Aspidapion aeneum]|uniref:16S rRNA (adenine(1518)-N(6)/adenine(1519)-N(6))- dimethyltransferase RsmA n=1 Tax=Spiroplasma endosymbiont of Aspidapion aeneum TaxID=3066276 RepID=UPI00313C665B
MNKFAKKRFGQNFITDSNLIKKIVSTLNNNYDYVIEIGPGKGALTRLLVDKFNKVIAIEIDKDFEDILNHINNKKLNIVWGNFLEIDFEKYINKSDKIAFISNTPYYLTSQIIFRLFEMSKTFNIKDVVLMVQKEVGERICAKVGEKKYNNLSVACNLFSNPTYKFTVKRNMFFPIPKVDSCIISFDFVNCKYKSFDQNNIIKMVRKLFNGKRKTILNNLRNTYPEIVNPHVMLETLSINHQLRPNELSVDKYIMIYNSLISQK